MKLHAANVHLYFLRLGETGSSIANISSETQRHETICQIKKVWSPFWLISIFLIAKNSSLIIKLGGEIDNYINYLDPKGTVVAKDHCTAKINEKDDISKF